VIDATGFIAGSRLHGHHTHYDAALSGWDPYATLSAAWRDDSSDRPTCRFRFCSRASGRAERSDAAHGRTERSRSRDASGMRWIGSLFPEFLDSLTVAVWV